MTITQPLGPYTDPTVRLHDGWCIITRRDHARDVYRVTTIPPAQGRAEIFEHPDLRECYAQLRTACGGRVPDAILRDTARVR